MPGNVLGAVELWQEHGWALCRMGCCSQAGERSGNREGGLSRGACRCGAGRRGKQLSRLPELAFQSAFGASKAIKHQQGALAAQLPDGPGPITHPRPPIREPHAARIACLL